jgi:SAM-dependent methyltransferase
MTVDPSSVSYFASVAADVGAPLAPNATVLDFGCGLGSDVEAWRSEGYRAFGCDIVLERPAGWLRLIETPYRLPFADATFDLVVSDQVMEHVQDHDLAFREIHRVLKPGAISLHRFPPRWRPIEVHVRMPLAGVVQRRTWVALWARLGVRNEFQADRPWREVTELDVEYLQARTRYLTRQQLLAAARRSFAEVELLEKLALKHGRRARRAYPFARIFPLLARVYGELGVRLLLLRRAGDEPRDSGYECPVDIDAAPGA